jgi:hypothetical protein
MTNHRANGYRLVKFWIEEKDYDALLQAAGSKDLLNGFCKMRLMEYVKWRHRDRRSEDYKARQAEKRAERQSRQTTVSLKEFLG